MRGRDRAAGEDIEILPIMDSEVEAVFAFKTCCGIRAFDQNLEIQVRNRGESPVVIQSRFDLQGPDFEERVAAVFPQGGLCLGPGEIRALYAQMDATRWSRAERIVLYDAAGRAYGKALSQGVSPVPPG